MRIDDYEIWKELGSKSEWIGIKVSLKKDADIAYWLEWNGSEFAENQDYLFLRDHFPEMLEYVVELLKRD